MHRRGCVLLAQVPSLLPPSLCPLRSERAEMMCRGNNTGQSLSLFLCVTPTRWILKSESFYEDTAGVPVGGLCSVGVQNKMGGQKTQTHFPIPARPKYDLVSLTCHYHSKDAWYAWCSSFCEELILQSSWNVLQWAEGHCSFMIKTIAVMFEILEAAFVILFFS